MNDPNLNCVYLQLKNEMRNFNTSQTNLSSTAINFMHKNIVVLGKETPSTTTKYLLKHKMSYQKTSAINVSAKIMEKNSPWLYVRYTDIQSWEI